MSDSTIIDTVVGMKAFLDGICDLPVEPPSLYIDLEGINLGRLGSVSIVTFYVLPSKKSYIVDVHVLQESAFSTANEAGMSLKGVLESATIPKVIFDVRNDSDALYKHFNISLDGMIDLQLMELATRDYSRAYVVGLAKCIERDTKLSGTEKIDWKNVKHRGHRLFDPREGGRYEVFNDRPLSDEMLKYCVQDVSLLPQLWEVYNAKLELPWNAQWKGRVAEETKRRVDLSQSASYNGKGRHMALGPW